MMQKFAEIMDNFTDSNFTNNGDFYSLPDAFRFTIVCLYIAVLLIAVIGNCLVIRYCLSARKREKVSSLFACSFAVSNATIALLCMPFTVISNLIFYYWSFPHYLCSLISYLQLLVVTQRVCSLVALTLHRHRSIVSFSSKKLTKRNGAIITILLWVFSAVFALPVLLKSKVIYLADFAPGTYGLCVEDWEHSLHLRNAYSVAIFIVQYAIPLVILTVAHRKVFRIVFRRKVPGERNQARDKIIKRSKKKTLVFLVFVVIAYAILWLPLHLITIIGDYMPSIYDRKMAHIAWVACHWLAFCDSCTYPLLILYKRWKKRNSFRNLICMTDDSEHYKISKEGVRFERVTEHFISSIHNAFVIL